MAERTADPYRDLDVIDAHAPRVNQAVIGAVALLAVATGWWPLLGLLCLQLVLGLTMGRRWCLACVAYFELLQPRIGEGPLEDAVVLGAATLAYAVGVPLAGAVLGLLVAGLALLAAVTGLCTGCEIYRLGARLRGIGSRRITRIDPADVGGVTDGAVVQFTHPLCSECHRLERDLRGQGRSVITVDVRNRPDLARKYGVAIVPTAIAVDGSGG